LAVLAVKDNGRARAFKRPPLAATLDAHFRTFLAATSQLARRQTMNLDEI
jgi:hypothetical protein